MKKLLLALFAFAIAATPCTAQPCTPAPAGLAAWWTFDDVNGGTTADRLGGPAAKLRMDTKIDAGRVASALRLGGSNYVDVPGERLNVGRGDFSLALWIRTSRGMGAVTTLIDKREVRTNSVRGYSLWMHDGRAGFQLADNSAPSAVCSNNPQSSACTNYGYTPRFADGAWHSLIVSVKRNAQDGGVMYLDGVAGSKFDPTLRRGSLDNSAPFRIGAHTGMTPHGFVEGLIDEVQFFRRALNPEEVKSIATAGDAGLCRNVAPTRMVSLEERKPKFVPGVVVIKLDAPAAAALRTALTAGTVFASLPFPPEVDALNRKFGAVKAEPLFPLATPGTPGGLERIFVVTIDLSYNTGAASHAYERARGVEYAEPDRIGRIQDIGRFPAIPGMYPQWSLEKIRLGPKSEVTGKGVVVAVLDTIIDVAHPDLKDNIDLNSKDFVNEPDDPLNPTWHGTHVAGIIAARDNGTGITGVAPDAKLMAVRCVKKTGEAASTGFATCLAHAVTSGAQVINTSWVVEAPPSFLEDAIFNARSHGAIFVAAGGNDGNSITNFAPANAESGITVAATTQTDGTSGLNYGTKLDVSAPGDDIMSTYPGNQYALASGTSMAAPHVAGLAALLLEKHKDWTPEEIRQAIRSSTDDVGLAGPDDRTGFGRIDVAKALNAPKPAVATIEQPYNGELVGGIVKVFGSAGNNWKLSIVSPAKGSTALAYGSASKPHGELAAVDTSKFPDGVYSLELTAQNGSAPGVDRNAIIIDNTTRRCVGMNTNKRCWPVGVSGGALKSPLVADLDRDGTKEIILGTAVFDVNGKPRPKWEGQPAGYGRSNPAIADIDNDGDLEIVAAVWSGLTQDDGLPNGGAPVIYALDHKRTQLWKYETRHGIPSTISIADLDGKGGPEIVFTVFFEENDATEVFILDAKGRLVKRFPVAGRGVSSVAIFPYKDKRLLVIPTDTNVHVVDRTGAAAAGWPQSNTNGQIDPVVADFDLDGKPEILVGETLWSIDGKRKTGYATGLAASSTGAAGQLAASDCELEVVLGGSDNVLYSVSKYNDATPRFSANNSGETIDIPIYDENGTAGVPILADLDGDGDVEVIRPSPLAFDEDVPAKLYATDGTSASAVPGFPRFVETEFGLIHSSATVDDIDNDGKTDLLIAGFDKLYAWDLGTPFDAANNPWPMFQRDLAHTGYLPPTTKGSDLWIEDTPVASIAGGSDTGAEPSAAMLGEPTWTSRAIRVERNPNRIVVTVKNRGCRPSPAGSLEIFNADPSIGLVWPANWKKIGTAAVPPIPPAGSVDVAVNWAPPPAGDFCLVARIASEPMTFAETSRVEVNVRKNNNLAWRRLSTIDLLSRTSREVRVNAPSAFNQQANTGFTFLVRDSFLADGGTIQVRVNGQLRPIASTRVDIPLPQNANQAIEILIAAPLTRSGVSNVYVLDVIATLGGAPIGGINFRITARGENAVTDNDSKADAQDANPLTPG